MIPPDQTPRDAIANVCQILRGALSDYGWVTFESEDVASMASRLERACQRMDEERASQGDWRRLEAAIRWALGESEEFKPRPISPRTGKFTAGVYYWRDELRKRAGLEWLPNKRGAVPPTAPPAEH